MTKRDPKGFVTNQVLNEVLDEKLKEVVDVIMQGMDNLYIRFKQEVASQFKPVQKDLEEVKTNTVFIKRDIKDIKEELSVTPTLRQFNELKSKVDRHILAS